MDSANGRSPPASPIGDSREDGVRLPWEWSFDTSLPPDVSASQGASPIATEPDDGRLLTYLETAMLLGVSKRSVRRWAAEGRLAIVPIGRLVRIRPSEIRRLVRDGLPSTGETLPTRPALATPGRLRPE